MNTRDKLGADKLGPYKLRRNVRIVSNIALAVCVVFWLWALENSIRRGMFDYGLISFAFGGVASTLGRKSSEEGAPGAVAMRCAGQYRFLGPASCALISINYAVSDSVCLARLRQAHYLSHARVLLRWAWRSKPRGNCSGFILPYSWYSGS